MFEAVLAIIVIKVSFQIQNIEFSENLNSRKILAYLFCTSTSSNVRLFHIMTKASPYKNTSISETLQESELVRPGFSHTGLFFIAYT